MNKARRAKLREANMQEIKDTARQLMTDTGMAGLSIRAIARQLDVTPPAIYYYFPSLDALITALTLDALNDVTAALEAATQASVSNRHYGEALQLFATAYRQWALQHPTDFQLVYGNSIPGYNRPPEVTYPPARRSFNLLARLVEGAIETGALVPLPEYRELPPALGQSLQLPAQEATKTVSPTAIYLSMVIWTHLYGQITLELFNLIQPIIGNMDVFYQFETLNMLRQLGLRE
jgi:AcrR family transcriptional regulator